jgi:hypothetical protein
VVVLYTCGDSETPVLGNNGMGYAEKLSSRYFRDREEAALYKEAMAIRKMKEQNPDFLVFVIDGREFTPEQLRASLDNEEGPYGAVDKWYRFIDSLPGIAEPYVDAKYSEKEAAVAAAVAEKEAAVAAAVARERGRGSCSNCREGGSNRREKCLANTLVTLHTRASPTRTSGRDLS